MAVVDRDHRRPAAAADALDRAQRELAVCGGLARRDAELALEGVEHRLRAPQPAADVRADLDELSPGGRQVEHVVEGRDRFDVRGGQVERVAHFGKSLRWQPAAMVFLSEPECGKYSGPRLWVLGCDGLDLSPEIRRIFGDRHRSTSPMTVSSEPTIAIRSAM